MLELSRTVRFCVSTHQHPADANPIVRNGFGGSPVMHGLGAYYELVVRCRGVADRATGFLTNISNIDTGVREAAIPIIEDAYRSQAHPPEKVLSTLVSALGQRLQGMLVSVQWRLTPYYWLSMQVDAPDSVLVSQQFEFAAAHRLHCEQFGDNRNRELFGRCNSPNGHGHNYRLQVTIAVPLARAPFPIERLEQVVVEHVIDRFDHTHLNLDTDEFAQLNPTVEHIAKVCHDLLLAPIKATGATLSRVTVWETEKTSCTYPAGC
jgi:6-pyruvoyltetrahydropterin/6-carboxytetrahydropterin synthase